MTVDVFLRKRRAKHAGEIGLFAESAIADEDFAVVPLDAEVRAELATERNSQMMKFVWALAGLIADNTEFYLDKADAMDGPQGLKIKARHCKLVVDQKTGECTVRPMSLKRLSNEAFQRLLKRMVWVVCNDVIPTMPEGDLRAEVEKMIEDKRKPKEPDDDAVHQP